MTPTLDQCRELERLYPGQFDNTEKVWVKLKTEDHHHTVMRSGQANYTDDWEQIASPSLGELVRVVQTQNIAYQKQLGNMFVDRTREYIPIDVSLGAHPEQALAAAMIIAAGDEVAE